MHACAACRHACTMDTLILPSFQNTFSRSLVMTDGSAIKRCAMLRFEIAKRIAGAQAIIHFTGWIQSLSMRSTDCFPLASNHPWLPRLSLAFSCLCGASIVFFPQHLIAFVERPPIVFPLPCDCHWWFRTITCNLHLFAVGGIGPFPRACI